MSGVEASTWQSVRDAVLARIHSREWPPGAPIPNEADLAQELGCARATVNRALRALAEEGLIERRRRAGSRVAEHPVRKATFAIPVIRREIEAAGGVYSHRLLVCQRAEPSAEVSARLRLRGAEPMLHVETLHLADGRAHGHEDRWVNLAAVPGIEGTDLARISANEWLVANVPFTGGDFVFTAAQADATLARHLGCAEGAALPVLERTTWNGEVPITWMRLAHAPGYRMRTRL